MCQVLQCWLWDTAVPACQALSSYSSLNYLVILAFQISITSAPMPCFIMHTQIITSVYEFVFYHNSPLLESVTMNQNGDINMFTKVIDTL